MKKMLFGYYIFNFKNSTTKYYQLNIILHEDRNDI